MAVAKGGDVTDAKKKNHVGDEEESCEAPANPTHAGGEAEESNKEASTEEETFELQAKSENDDKADDDDGPSTSYKVAVCVVAGIFASQMQFAFVFGDQMIAIAEDPNQGPGSTPASGTSAVIWLFAISLGAPPSIVYGLYSNPPEISLRRLYQCPWYRHVLILLTTSIPWVTHIHLYGYANTFLPSDLAASVAWPILMMMTVLTGMVWSISLGEWQWATREARRKLYQGLGIVTLGIGVIMASVAI